MEKRFTRLGTTGESGLRADEAMHIFIHLRATDAQQVKLDSLSILGERGKFTEVDEHFAWSCVGFMGVCAHTLIAIYVDSFEQ